MVIIAALVLTILAFAAIAMPFFRQGRQDIWAIIGSKTPDVFSVRNNVLLKQLEKDYRSGILSEEEYLSQRNAFAGTPVDIAENPPKNVPDVEEQIESRIKNLRLGSSNITDDDEIERKIRQLRANPATNSTDRVTTAQRQNKARFCSQCGANQQPGDRFCRQCGERLT